MSFSDRETLELVAVSLSFEALLPCLTFTWFCFVCGTVSLVFICNYRKCRNRSDSLNLFFASRWISPCFSMCGLLHISFSFPVELSHLILSDCYTMLFHYLRASFFSFYFIHWPYFVWNATLFVSFSEWNSHTFLCVTVTMQVSIFFAWTSYMYPFVFFLGHNWPVLVLILSGLPRLISYMKTPLFLLPWSILVI